MKSCTEKQIEALEKLYLSGKLDGSQVGDWRILSRDNADRLIVSSQNNAEGTFQPITQNLKTALLHFIQERELVAEEMVWTFKSAGKISDRDISHAQCCRIRVLMGKGFLKYRPMSEIKNLSNKAAKALIAEGEENALDEE